MAIRPTFIFLNFLDQKFRENRMLKFLIFFSRPQIIFFGPQKYFFNTTVYWVLCLYLNNRIHVTRVSQISKARIAGTIDGHQLTTTLLYAIPLAHFLIQVDLQLGHRFLRLLHSRHVYAEMWQVHGQVGILDHIVFVVRVDVGLGGRDRAQFDGERVFRLSVVLNCVVVATRAVQLTTTAQDYTVC